mmetsp:Transcript_25393/g.70032  ORF Transcript_25393/g.70032 Transcript_25393/m.70032 type:complete len:208 (-) Transcript_25393:766-1389(-)
MRPRPQRRKKLAKRQRAKLGPRSVKRKSKRLPKKRLQQQLPPNLLLVQEIVPCRTPRPPVGVDGAAVDPWTLRRRHCIGGSGSLMWMECPTIDPLCAKALNVDSSTTTFTDPGSSRATLLSVMDGPITRTTRCMEGVLIYFTSSTKLTVCRDGSLALCLPMSKGGRLQNLMLPRQSRFPLTGFHGTASNGNRVPPSASWRKKTSMMA